MRRVTRAVGLVLALNVMFCAAWPGPSRGAEAPGAKVAVVAEVDGPIGPATMRYLGDALEKARTREAEVLVLRLNTPGGLASSMREIIADILASSVPVVGYVSPPGAHAASAGTYILYATHVAAMAPGTNLGAATPVQIGGPPPRGGAPEERKDDGEAPEEGARDPMARKAVNDAVAYIRSLAELRGRNAEWAEKAVRAAASLSATAALEAHVVDVLADDVPTLLEKIDGYEVRVGHATRRLETSRLALDPVEPGWLNEVLAVLTNPNVAFILMLIGVYGLIFEFANPGSIGPGVVGAISLLLGLYSLNLLPLNYAGLGLLLLGIALMAAEAFTPTFGVLGVGGLAAFVLGAALLLDTDAPGFRLSWTVIGGAAVASGALLTLLLSYLRRSHGRPITTGASAIRGAEAVVLDWAEGRGHVRVHGERWAARGPGRLAAGDRVRVAALDGLTLVVEPLAKQTGKGE